MRILLVWQEIPESTKFYILENLSEQELDVLAKSHGGLINSTSNTDEQETALSFVSFALTDPKYAGESKEKYAAQFEFKGDIDFWLSRWFKNEIDEATLPIRGPFDQVFVSGFIL